MDLLPTHPRTLCSATLVLGFLFSAPTLAQVDYGDIEPQGTGVPLERDGAKFFWLSTYEGVPLFRDSQGADKLGELEYLEEFVGLWQDDDFVLLATIDRDDPDRVDRVVGYARSEDLLLSGDNLYECLKAENRISRKALVVHRWAEGDRVVEQAALRKKPDASAPVEKEINLYDILYVYAVTGGEGDSEGFCLVGNRPSCQAGFPSGLTDVFEGWLPNERVFFWNHREAVEYNRDPAATKWRQDQGKPVQFFASEEDVRAGLVAVEEDLTKGAWRYHVQRYPIVSETPVVIDGKKYLAIGVVGDSYTESGVKTPLEMEADIRLALEESERDISNLNVVFVIDATGSMSSYYRSIKESVGMIRAGIERGREQPIQYAVLYYRDYTEGADRDSFIHEFFDFRESSIFGSQFPHVTSGGGQSNPPPLYGLHTAVTNVSWQPNSMRAVLLIGDMGNQEPDARGFTTGSIIETLKEYNCEFYAIQAQPEERAPKYLLFNRQAQEIASGLGMPESRLYSSVGDDVSGAILQGVGESNQRAMVLRDALAVLKDGGDIEAINAVLGKANISIPTGGGDGSRTISFGKGEYGTNINNRLFEILEDKGIDPDRFKEKRIQHFGIALAAEEFDEGPVPDQPNPSFSTKVLMVRSEFQQLTAALGQAVLGGINPSNATEVWRRIVNQLSGDLDDEATFDETRPISEYLTMALGIPVRSELLNKSVVEIKRMPPADVAKLREDLELKVAQMNNFDNEMNPEGTQSERHWFLMHGIYYGWVPLWLMP